MRTLSARYAAWCRRQGTMQCNPVAIGLGIVLVACLVTGIKIHQELTVHWTGFMQVVAGAGAVLACLAAAGLVHTAMRIVAGTPAPVTPAPETVPASRKPAIITALTLTPEDAAAMQADADALADGGELDLSELDEARP